MIWLFIGLGIYFALCLILTWISIKPPRTPILCSPGAFGAPQETVEIQSKGSIRLSAWWVPAKETKSVAILCHGYFLSKGELAPVAYALWREGISCLLFDFRCHGKSNGGSCSFGYRERDDVLAAVEWVRAKIPDAKIVLIGSSMGSVASAFAFAERPDQIQALVLDSAYNRLSDAVLGWWRFVGGWPLAILLSPTVLLGIPFMRLNPFQVKVSDALAKLKGKSILVMNGDKDLVAAPRQVLCNVKALGPEAEAMWFEGCGHSEGRWEQPDRYYSQLLQFLRKDGFLP
jgi:pimeloyl-ACP methyl ester carboxylesterase